MTSGSTNYLTLPALSMAYDNSSFSGPGKFRAEAYGCDSEKRISNHNEFETENCDFASQVTHQVVHRNEDIYSLWLYQLSASGLIAPKTKYLQEEQRAQCLALKSFLPIFSRMQW